MNPFRLTSLRVQRVTPLLLLVCAWSVAQSAEHLWDPFDAYPEGSVADQSGWTRAPWLNTQTALVSSVRAYSAPHALELPWHADGSSAVYTNFVSTYAPGAEHPIIRFSARIYQENTNTAFQLGIRNSVAGHFLSFQSANGRGTFGFEHADSGRPLTTNDFVEIIGYYNRSNNTYRFDYDNAHAVLWGPADTASAHAQFNQFVVRRQNDTAQTAGDLFVDNVAAVYPASAVGVCRTTRTICAFLPLLLPRCDSTRRFRPGMGRPERLSQRRGDAPIGCADQRLRVGYPLFCELDA